MMREIRRRGALETAELGEALPPLLKRIYASRGVRHADELALTLDRLLPVNSLEGVPAGVELLLEHRRDGHILIVGDFDADGATGSALLVRALRALGFARVEFLVPDRFKLGYGLTPEIVSLAAMSEPSLIVTVDNGISSLEGVAAARARGIPVLITDHHLPGPQLPAAQALINPNIPGSRFGSRALCGVGVAFYLIAALARALEPREFRAADLLDLVALGTVADLVPLDRNNRILVAQGLKRMRAGRCVPGLRALAEHSKRDLERLEVADLAFALAPRVNAAGRLADMSIGIRCLITDDAGEARQLARELSELNQARREIELKMQREALELLARVRLEPQGGDFLGLCLFDETWHQGVVGLVAGRVKERVHRPVIAFARDEGDALRGSARSVDGIHIRDVLEEIATRHPGLVRRFGGHAMAAGLTLERARFEEFREAFAAAIAARAEGAALAGILLSDGELEPAQLSVETARLLQRAGPWGAGFPEPVFDGAFRVAERRVLSDRHLKLRLLPRAGDGRYATGLLALDAIYFGFLEGEGEGLPEPPAPGAEVHVGYRLEVNEYEGLERAQLNCQHLALL
ncbi:MAG TPA: single-stranded-DNA-specific exonuclease RecJ [Steroidobacteraceae bacterium]|nr:single-stranded-DNA-specific exonuclease RecJ [Steroidobacteraceae bacterium]